MPDMFLKKAMNALTGKPQVEGAVANVPPGREQFDGADLWFQDLKLRWQLLERCEQRRQSALFIEWLR
jgi:hypothetical protein